MRKFLSLVLALVMMMSLITINTSAVEFKDGEDITYDEAVDVISTIHVVDGYPDGSFNPTGNLTRGAAAKIICNMLLGPTTASQLSADTAPFRDVPVNHDFAGYIAYCQKEGIISGYGDGNFYPAGSLTGNAFMKMLLGALGYDAEIEQYVGPNWTINVAKRAIGIGLDDGLTDGVFNGSRLITREEACLYAFNTLQADLVEYSSKITANVNGAEVTVGNSNASSREWTSQQTRINNIREDEIIQFAEEYFNKLEKKTGDDEFMRPAYTWIYDKEEIGTYVDWSLMIEEYTTEVTGRDLYDVLGSSLLNDDDMDLEYYVNGDIPDSNTILPAYVLGSDFIAGGAKAGQKDITKTNNTIRRNNQDGVGITADGVLTQVFVDKDNREKIIITSIDTWLAQAGADYNESTELAAMEIWTARNSNPGLTKNVDVQDVPEVADVTEDTFYLLSLSFKDDDDGDVVAIWEPEILEEKTITKFSVENSMPTKLTTDGTEYVDALREYYDPAALYEYDQSLLSDRSYNVFLDQFGYVIGIELNEGAKNYVFITGFDRPTSNLAVKTADAAGIFLDGTMQEIKVNVTDTDKNIEKVNPIAAKRTGSYATNLKSAGNEYFLPWQYLTTHAPQRNGFQALNRWFTYTVNKDGVYTLKPATRMVAYKNPTDETIKTDSLYLDDNIMFAAANGADTAAPYHEVDKGGSNAVTTLFKTDYPYTGINGDRCYGNDDSVYITVDADIVDTLTQRNGVISGVNGVYTGVQNVEIELDLAAITSERPLDEAYIYAVYDSDNYIVGAVTVGEGNGGNATIAYVTSGAKSERIEDDVYYWEFEAIVDGEVQTLTVKDKYGSVLNAAVDKSAVNNEAEKTHETLAAATRGTPISDASSSKNWNAYDGIVELRMDTDGYVVGVKPVAENKIYSYFGDKTGVTKYLGGNSITTSGNPWNTAQTDRMSDYSVYRIGGVPFEAVGAQTWDVGSPTVAHHYDSAPEVLTLVGRTLYVTEDQHDEGLALATDAKSVVIQQENGKWKTREFSNVSSGVAQVADADRNTLNGKQYNGEIVAVLNNRGQAVWVVFTSYTDLKSGAGWTPGGPNTVNNVAVQYIDPDGNGSGSGTNGDEYTAFKLYNTAAGKKYTVTMYTSFGGVTTTRTKVVTGKQDGDSLYTGTTDGFYGKLDAGTQITITCEEGVGTYIVPGDGSLIRACTL